MLTRAIPKEAMEIVVVLRATVSRPRQYPKLIPLVHDDTGKPVLRWPLTRARRKEINNGNPGHCCPMGLCELANCPAPANPHTFGDFGYNEIRSMGIWWDEQADAKAAVDAVWPKGANDEGE